MLYIRVRIGVSPTVAVMPTMADANEYWMEWLCQAFGWSALIWAWLTTVLGLTRSGPRPSWLRLTPARIERWHRTTSLTTIGLMFAHAFFMFTEVVRENAGNLGLLGRLGNGLAVTFVPGVYSSGATGKAAILIGLIAFYLAIPLGLAFYLRHRTGARIWRVLHRFVLAVYVLSVWHTLLYGTNVWFEGALRTTVWLLQVPIALLLLARLLRPARPAERTRAGLGHILGLAVAAATALALLVIGITGNDWGHLPGAPAGTPLIQRWMVWTATAVLLAALAGTVAYARANASTHTRTSSSVLK